jgi:hypothetical protein
MTDSRVILFKLFSILFAILQPELNLRCEGLAITLADFLKLADRGALVLKPQVSKKGAEENTLFREFDLLLFAPDFRT